MCCVLTLLIFLGPRVGGIAWWLIQPVRWVGNTELSAFNSIIWPILGIIFLPWTTLMYVAVSPGGVDLIGWLFIGLGVVADIAMHGGGSYFNRERVPGMSSGTAA